MNDVKPSSVTQADYRALAEGFASAIKGQDADILRSITTDTVTWSLPGASIIAGVAHGVAGILRRGKRLADYGVDIRVTHIVYGHTGVGFLLHNTGSRLGRTLDEHLTTVLQVECGQISRADTYISDVGMLDSYFAP